MLSHVSDNTASQLFIVSTGTVTAFLSPSKHVEGTTKHLFKQESKTRRVYFFLDRLLYIAAPLESWLKNKDE